ncbi:hypothetical protein UP06_18820 [Bradyrhizobium sp. LTSP857]|nr:hypothetical protein UP06_18820 [Bradyrhizobium sp. LTSP857]
MPAYSIDHMRSQIGRQRNEILQLQRAGIPTASAEALLGRMQAKVDDLCDRRDRLKGEEPLERPCYASGKPLKGTPAHRKM